MQRAYFENERTLRVLTRQHAQIQKNTAQSPHCLSGVFLKLFRQLS
jgi:hypothetical protein